MESAEVQEDTTVMDTRAKLEYINSVLGMIGSIESAVPKVLFACCLSSIFCGYKIDIFQNPSRYTTCCVFFFLT